MDIDKGAEPIGMTEVWREMSRGILVPNPDYHRRQAAIFKRLSETARHPDTAAALLWLAEEHRAQGELSKSPQDMRPSQPPASQ